jgi:lipid-A-disaccharide synthase
MAESWYYFQLKSSGKSLFIKSSSNRQICAFATMRLCVEMKRLKPKSFMLIAGEASGDLLAAELAAALRARLPDAVFFGAGGANLSGAGVELVHEMSRLSVVGVTDVLAKLFELRRLMKKLLAAAIARQPDVIIGVDYGGFNLRFGHAVKEHVRHNPFSTWKPKIVQFVSPQVWASRPGRAKRLAEDYDLLLSIFPFEKDWYAQRVPKLRVEFVGHPMVGRFATEELRSLRPQPEIMSSPNAPQILLLPGSRKSELKRHLPPMLDALKAIQEKLPLAGSTMVLPGDHLLPMVVWEISRRLNTMPDGPFTLAGVRAFAQKCFPNLEIQIGGLPQALARSDVAIAKTGTVTMECAFFGVPAVTLYRGSWLNYQIARHLITVKTFTMPNLLANEEVYPEFLQYDLTAENLARAALELLQNEARREKIKTQLARVIASLGPPGAPQRAAEAVLSLLNDAALSSE